MAKYGVDSNVAYVYFTNNYKETTATPNGMPPNIPTDKGKGGDWLPNNPNANDETTKNGNLQQAIVGVGVLRTGKQIINYARTNYGDIIQDSIAQMKLNEAFSIGGQMASIGIGFAKGGIVGGTSMLLATATSYGLQAVSMARQYHRSDVISQVNMMRVGNSAINGGR